MKMIEVVAAIIERDGKNLICATPRPDGSGGIGGSLPVVKLRSRMKVSGRLVRELREELGIEATAGEYVASHQREVLGAIIHLHAWHVPDFHGTLQAHEHQALVWCSPEEVLHIRWPLLTFHY